MIEIANSKHYFNIRLKSLCHTDTQKGNSHNTNNDFKLGMRNLSPKSRTRDVVFVEKVCDLSRRGDVDGIIELMHQYFVDKKASPWHRIIAIISRKWEPNDKDLPEIMILVRDAVFSALGILSLSLALEESTTDILEIFCKAKSWKEGRMKVRSYCSEKVLKMIKNKQTKYLDPDSLSRDGFSFLTPELLDAELMQFKKAKPKIKNGKLLLGPLRNTRFGRELLSELEISDISIDENDPYKEEILEAYESRLVELELKEHEIIPEHTVQLTLNGSPANDDELEIGEKQSKSRELMEQESLEAFVAADKETPKKTKKASKPKPKKRSKKKRGDKN